MVYAKHMKHDAEAGENTFSPALPALPTRRPSTTHTTSPAPKKKKKKLVQVIVAIVFVVGGLLLLSYPFVSDWLNQQAQNEISAQQEQKVATLSQDNLEEEKKAATAYNTRLLSGSAQVIDPFDAHNTLPGNEDYNRVLNVAGDGVMGELFIPSISVDLPIYHYTTDETLAHGVGHVVNTSVPIGGPSTHAVLAGHTGLPSARLFDRLEELKTGDYFIIRVLGEDHAYKVTSTEVVLPEEVMSLSVEEGKDQVTLVTCTPYGVNTHRLLVHGERCEVPDAWKNGSNAERHALELPQSRSQILLFTIAGIILSSLLVLIVLLVLKIRKNKKD